MNAPEDFRGDFHELAALMKESWAGNTQEPLLYTEEFLQSTIGNQSASFSFCPAVYEQDALIAFGAGMVRNVRYAGTTLHLLLDSFITVSPAARGKGLGAKIWHDLAARARRAGLDGLITFCVQGEHMDRKLMSFAQDDSMATAKVFTVTYLARPVPRSRTPDAQRADPKTLITKSAELETSFRRIWTDPDGAWQCHERVGAFGCSLPDTQGKATITAYAMLTGGAKPVRCGLVDDVLWEGTDDAQRSRMVNLLLDSARGMEVELLLVPVLNYFDPALFVAAGFRKTRRTLNLYLTFWNGVSLPSEMDSVYVDVF
jgi:GNAT superfamily N-acetyltransferase